MLTPSELQTIRERAARDGNLGIALGERHAEAVEDREALLAYVAGLEAENARLKAKLDGAPGECNRCGALKSTHQGAALVCPFRSTYREASTSFPEDK